MKRLTLKLTSGQRRRLERQLQSTHDARVCRRSVALREFSRGRSVAQIARTLGTARRTVSYWIEDYCQRFDPAALVDADRPGRPRLWSEELRALLQSLLANYAPEQLGYFAVNWTVPLLQEQLKQGTGQWLSDDTIRRELQRLGYAWKRSRYVLEPDPEQEKKTADSQENSGYAAASRPAGRG
jgi:transposase